LSSLHNICSQILKNITQKEVDGVDAGHALFATHICLLLSLSSLSSLQPHSHYTPENILKLARKYTVQTQSSSCDLWLARLQAESQLSPSIRSEQQDDTSNDNLKSLVSQARKACTSKATEDDFQSLEKLWSYGWDAHSFDEQEVNTSTCCFSLRFGRDRETKSFMPLNQIL
jgi:hypothetical protein